MQRNADQALRMILEHEGGYVNDPQDPGGATNMGVTQNTLDRVREQMPRVKLPADVKDLTRAQAKAIYRHDYWKPVAGSELPAGLDIAVVDMAVNQGVGDAVRALQDAAGAKVDGIMGPNTKAAVSAADPRVLIVDFHALRALNYAQLSADLVKRYGFGWYRRMERTFWIALKEMGA